MSVQPFFWRGGDPSFFFLSFRSLHSFLRELSVVIEVNPLLLPSPKKVKGKFVFLEPILASDEQERQEFPCTNLTEICFSMWVNEVLYLGKKNI